MSDCDKILILTKKDNVEAERVVVMFNKKKQILWTAIRLLYMLISRSNRIGDSTHLFHMNTETGVQIEDETE
jgi:hypothetical protein